MPMEMYEAALKRAKEKEHKTFSDYVQFLVATDLRDRPDHARGVSPRAHPASYLRVADSPGSRITEDPPPA